MVEYIFKSLLVCFLGYFPYFGIYFVVPTAILLGLDFFSIVFWGILGNYLAVPTVDFFFEKLMNIKSINNWFNRKIKSKYNHKFYTYLNKYTKIVLILFPPLVGVWFSVLVSKVLGIKRKQIYLYTFLSIILHTVIVFLLINIGVIIIPQDLPKWFSFIL